jgi:hypothetical protein
MAHLWLQVHEHHWGPGYGFPSELWSREVQIEGTPEVTDDIMLLRSDDEPEGAVTHTIKRRYWDWAGVLNLELRGIVHLPNDKYEEELNGSIPACTWEGHTDWERYYRHYPLPWREEDDEYGLLADRLHESGWKTFKEKRG